MKTKRRRCVECWVTGALVLSVLGACPAAAGMSVSIDAETLQDVLAAVTLDDVSRVVERVYGGDRPLVVRLGPA